MSTDTKENNQAVRRACRIFKTLAGHALEGVTLKEIAEAINTNDPSTLRLLQTLQQERMVTQFENKRWALAMGMLQIAQATDNELTRAGARVKEMHQRIHAGAASIENRSL